MERVGEKRGWLRIREGRGESVGKGRVGCESVRRGGEVRHDRVSDWGVGWQEEESVGMIGNRACCGSVFEGGRIM